MKRLLCITVAAFILNACEKESTSFENNSETASDIALAFDVASLNSNIGIYKGVFTTEDSQTRGIIEMTIPGTTTFVAYYGQFPTATLTLSNGTVLLATADRRIAENEPVSDVQFSGDGLSFVLNMNDDGSEVTFSDINLNGTTSYALIKKHTNRAPISPITGVYQCVECQDHPNLEAGLEQSFNVLVDEATGDISTSVMLGTVEFTGTGLQGDCVVNGVLTSCDTIGEFDSVGGTSISWDGTHLYNNEDTMASNDCSDFDGAWTWVTNSYGTISGTFSSDVTPCTQDPATLVFEDFEDASVTYTTSVPEFTDANSDYFTRTDGTNIASNVDIAGVEGSSFFGAQDIDGEVANANQFINFDNLDITGLNNITFSALFAEDDSNDGNEDYDDSDFVRIEYSFDGTNYTTFFGIVNDGREFNGAPLKDTDLDGIGDGAEITDTMTSYSASFVNDASTNPMGVTTVSIRISIDLNGGDEDIAIDNVLIQGN
ncbi:MAG: hypothetical protein ACSHW7_14695 [Patiriisocius sp.]|uniref:hypothetical protein n=1 Tax=Patiriisocius sp. TaxID=2822396 RepID=UPI003EF704BA